MAEYFLQVHFDNDDAGFLLATHYSVLCVTTKTYQAIFGPSMCPTKSLQTAETPEMASVVPFAHKTPYWIYNSCSTFIIVNEVSSYPDTCQPTGQFTWNEIKASQTMVMHMDPAHAELWNHKHRAGPFSKMQLALLLGQRSNTSVATTRTIYYNAASSLGFINQEPIAK